MAIGTLYIHILDMKKKVKDNLEQRIKVMGMTDDILQILIPTQQVAEVKDGKKRVYMKTFFPGYILVQTARELHPGSSNERDQKIWHNIKEIPGVMGFVGSGTTPTPLSEEEVRNILQVTKGEEEQKTAPVVTFTVGDKVKVIDGPFIGFPGEVTKIDQEKQKLTVMIPIFDRSTPVELEFTQIEKV
jgi:transcriptional antiterminator NusG